MSAENPLQNCGNVKCMSFSPVWINSPQRKHIHGSQVYVSSTDIQTGCTPRELVCRDLRFCSSRTFHPVCEILEVLPLIGDRDFPAK